MNLRVAIYIPYTGMVSDLEPLISDLTDVIVGHGYVNSVEDEPGSNVKSLLVIKDFDIDDANVDEFLTEELQNSLMVILPTTGEINGKDGSSGTKDSNSVRKSGG